MRFTNNTLAAIELLRKEVSSLEAKLRQEKKTFYESLVENGWRKFDFHSVYYGSHEEYGEGDKSFTFYFKPEVDLSRWSGVEFSHGHHSDNEVSEFESWLEELGDESFYFEEE